jgi:hypothetical protein
MRTQFCILRSVPFGNLAAKCKSRSLPAISRVNRSGVIQPQAHSSCTEPSFQPYIFTQPPQVHLLFFDPIERTQGNRTILLDPMSRELRDNVFAFLKLLQLPLARLRLSGCAYAFVFDHRNKAVSSIRLALEMACSSSKDLDNESISRSAFTFSRLQDPGDCTRSLSSSRGQRADGTRDIDSANEGLSLCRLGSRDGEAILGRS